MFPQDAETRAAIASRDQVKADVELDPQVRIPVVPISSDHSVHISGSLRYSVPEPKDPLAHLTGDPCFDSSFFRLPLAQQ